ncbi:toll/interleukin-1 receptor domain-containing protein [Arthrobacter sp. NA-172]|uniref:toll/interleukin-1 receptor domain-containing protein n=1 Tax=Arthrobacter sp. NA-172 TaxID=3367524 RepID=UPI0037547F48
MKVFISWSGPESKAVALLLKPWLRSVLQATKPWMSDTDIQAGTKWESSISTQLRESGFGIICVTDENQNTPWINFEAGALSMAIADIERRVVPLLIGFNDRGDLKGPLNTFNTTLFNEEGVYKMLLSINSQLEEPLEESALKKSFGAFWPELESEVEKLQEQGKLTTAPARDDKDILNEILDTVRSLSRDRDSTKAQIYTRALAKLAYGDPLPRNEELIGVAEHQIQEYLRSVGNSAQFTSKRTSAIDTNIYVHLEKPLDEEQKLPIVEATKLLSSGNIELLFVDEH